MALLGVMLEVDKCACAVEGLKVVEEGWIAGQCSRMGRREQTLLVEGQTEYVAHPKPDASGRRVSDEKRSLLQREPTYELQMSALLPQRRTDLYVPVEHELAVFPPDVLQPV